jgi:pimeloyl-ACP methyl ester carboxylesterase
MPYTNIKNIEYYYNIYNENCSYAVVLIHGHPFDGTMWDYQLPALQQYKIVVPHLRGYGKTVTNQSLIFTDEHAIDIAYLLDEQAVDKVVLVGLSMGGQIVAEFARLFPHRTLGLCIVGNLPFAETDETTLQKKQLASWILENGLEAYTKRDIELFVNRSIEPVQNEMYNHLFSMMAKNNTNGAAANLKGRTYRRNNAGFIQNFSKPLQFIAAEFDSFCSKEVINNFTATCLQSEVQIVANAGHVCNMEQPDIFNAILQNFLLKVFKLNV